VTDERYTLVAVEATLGYSDGWWAAHLKAQRDSGHSQVSYYRARGREPKYLTLWKHTLRDPPVPVKTLETPAP